MNLSSSHAETIINNESKEDLISRPEIQRLLAVLRERSLFELVPRITPQGDVIYPEAAEIMKVGGSQCEEILERMARAQILVKEPVNPIVLCPTCGSKNTSQSLVCPNCGGTELTCGQTLQHLSCLHFDFESNFQRTDHAVVCPKCNRELASIGVDHLRPGTFYKCASCAEFTARAKRLIACHTCQQVSETTKAPPIQSYRFALLRNAGSSGEAKHFDFTPLLESLTKKGYDAHANGTVRGKSGVDHSFSIIASHHSHRGSELRVAVHVEIARIHVESTSVLAMFAKAVDCGIKSRFLIAVPRLSQEAAVLAQSYNITHVEARDSVDAGEKLEFVLDSVSGTKYTKSKVQSGSKATRKRTSMDIMADILAVVTSPSSKYEMMACANLSYEQCQKYIPMLEKLGLVRRYLEDGVRARFLITEKGREYSSSITGEFGKIAQGDRTIWPTKRQPSSIVS